MGQETLIYIDDQDKTNANITSKGFADKNVRNRAYYNSIGAGLVTKFLISENIKAENYSGLHSIKKVLEEIDVSDIILPNIRIDVRTVFDENIIFVPKSHFEYDILPDIYTVIKTEKDLSGGELLGFFKPSIINKNNANKDYYFVEKEKLTSGSELIDYIKSYQGNTIHELSEDELEASETVIMEFSDNDIAEDTKKYLIKQLLKSPKLREKYIDYENFEALSYKAMTDPMIDVPELPKDTNAQDEFEIFEPIDTTDSETVQDIQNLDESSINEEVTEETLEEVTENKNDDPEIVNEKTEFAENSEVLENNNTELSDPNNSPENIDVIDENTIENISDTTNVSVTATGLDAIDKVTDTMEDILFDDETVKAIENIDLIQTEENNDIKEPLSVNIEEVPEIEQPITDENTLSFDDVVVPNIEKSENDENIDDNNTLSFDDVIVSDVNTDENVESLEDIEKLDNNKISFDDVIVSDVDTDENVESLEDIEKLDNNKISFDDVIVSDVDTDENVESFEDIENNTKEIIEDNSKDVKVNEDSLSVDEVNVSNNENTDDIENTSNSMLSFDNIESVEVDSKEPDSETLKENTLSFDDIKSVQETSEQESDKETEFVDPINASEQIVIPETDEIYNEDIIVENIDTKENNSNTNNSDMNEEVLEIEKFSDNTNETSDNKNTSNESFGKNLLENLSSESLDNIVIEGVDESGSPEVSSEDLLSQIDDALNSSSSLNDTESKENNITTNNNETSEENKLDLLYNESNEINTENELEEITDYNEEDVPLAFRKPANSQLDQKNKKTLAVAAVLIVILLGISVSIFMKPKNNTTANVESLNNPDLLLDKETQNNENNVDNITPTDNILESNAPVEVKTEQVKPIPKSDVQEMKNTPPVSSGTYMSVSKLKWDIPAGAMINTTMQQYLKSVGKSVKISLSTDLLLATEYAYTNLVKVNVKLGPNGNVENVSITSGSGSGEIDKIVLQSVNETLKALKPPSNGTNGQILNLTLIIYF